MSNGCCKYKEKDNSLTLDEYEQMSLSCFSMYFRSDFSPSKVVPLVLLSHKAISRKHSKNKSNYFISQQEKALRFESSLAKLLLKQG